MTDCLRRRSAELPARRSSSSTTKSVNGRGHTAAHFLSRSWWADPSGQLIRNHHDWLLPRLSSHVYRPILSAAVRDSPYSPATMSNKHMKGANMSKCMSIEVKFMSNLSTEASPFHSLLTLCHHHVKLLPSVSFKSAVRHRHHGRI
ncbi:hypothetical protein LIA77_10767 [Sarocladium implicatum]|nr:hypothetical protein LIA77_10767 [Sarocladium implicatum]